MEIKAVVIGIYTHCKNKIFLPVRAMSDNVTTIAYINNMGAIKSEIIKYEIIILLWNNNIAYKILNFCTENNMWISAVDIPGKDDIEADHQSRILQDATEWKVHPELFQKIVDKFGKPDIDLFASKINR